MSMGKTESTGKPVWASGQMDLINMLMGGPIASRAFGGTPDPVQGIQAARAREGFGQTMASQGMTGSGLAAKGAVGLEQGIHANDAQAWASMVDRIFAPLSNRSAGSQFQGPLPISMMGGS